MMKRKYYICSLVLLAFVLLNSLGVSAATTWSDFRGNAENNAVVSAPIPNSAEKAALYWAVKAGSDYSAAPSNPIIVNDVLVYTSGTSIIKLDTVSGNKLQEGTMSGKGGYNIIPPTYDNGVIYVALANGSVEAFDFATLKSKWIYKDLDGASHKEDGKTIPAEQALSPVTCYKGKIYTGFWRSETTDANFVCLDAASGSKLWSVAHKGGYYWAGAYVCDDYVLVGTDNGVIGESDNGAELLCLNPETGEVIARVSNIIGNIRSSICFDKSSSTAYFTTQGGYFYGFQVEKGDSSVTLTQVVNIDLRGKSTSTPVIYNGRAYVGVSGSAQYTSYSGHNISVIDIATESVAYTCPTKGFPQTSGLLTTNYDKGDKTAYVYFVDNMAPGKIRVIKDKPGQTKLDASTAFAPVLFTPSGNHGQYAICSPICDEYGTLYFKNDSGYIFALGNLITDIKVTKQPVKTSYTAGEIFDKTGMQITATYSSGKTRDVTSYVTYKDTALTEDDFDFDITFPYVLYHDTVSADDGDDTNDGKTTGVKLQQPKTSLSLIVTGKADPEPEPEPQPEPEDKPFVNPFADVKSSDYFYDAVQWAVENEITAGTDSTHFSPKATCTRCQIVTFLWRAKGSPVVIASNPFVDVKSSDYYYNAVLWAVKEGITSGTDALHFSPKSPCTRAQAVTFQYRSAGSPQVSGSNVFKDVSNNAYYAPAVKWAVQNGITAGTSATTFAPESECQRSHIVCFLYRQLK